MFREKLRTKISQQHNAIMGFLYVAEANKDEKMVGYYAQLEKELREWLEKNR